MLNLGVETSELGLECAITVACMKEYCQGTMVFGGTVLESGTSVQPPSDAEQRSTLEAVIKVLWSVTTAHEEDPDSRSMIRAVLQPCDPPPKNVPAEDALEQADTAQASALETGSPPAPTEDPPGNQNDHAEEKDAFHHSMVWPQTDVEFWKLVEGMLDLRNGCAVVGNKVFTAWISSVLQCRPALL